MLASSYEAKALGVTTGTASRDAKKILGSKGIFVEPDFQRYQHLSDRIFSILQEYCKEMEIFSIDECFMNISYREQDENTYYQRAKEVQNRIYQDVGIPITLGIGPTRLLAKMFAKINKPHGIYVNFRHNGVLDILGDKPITTIPFIGKRRAKRLIYQAKTVREFYDCDIHTIRGLMGKNGEQLRYELHGVHAMSFRQPEKPRSIRRSKSFHPSFTKNKTTLRDFLMVHINTALAVLYKQQGMIRYIRITLRTKEFTRHSQDILLKKPVHQRNIIVSICKDLFERTYQQGFRYRTTSVTFSHMIYTHGQHSLFEEETNIATKDQKITELISRLHTKYGEKIVGYSHDVLATKKNEKHNHNNCRNIQLL